MNVSHRAGPHYWARTLGVLCLVLSASSALAQPAAPPPPANFFTDRVGVVPKDVAATIERRLRDLQAASSNQVLVVVADRMPEGYGSIEEYTNRTAEAWRVGDKSRDNGAVLFVFVGDRKVRIEVGYGLEGPLPDALASRIINDEITPKFRAGRYGDGILAGVDAIILATKGEYKPLAKSRAPAGPRLILPIVLLLVLVFVIIPFLRQIDLSVGARTYSGRGSTGWKSSGWGGGGGGGSSWGGSSGGGFSGGGGSFGGGGASGSW